MLALLAAAGGVIVGFGVARSLFYERWLRDRRDLAAIARRQQRHKRYTQGGSVNARRSNKVARLQD